MTSTEKQTKILAASATSYGATGEVYINEIRTLVAAGQIEGRECFSKAGGYRNVRYFLKNAA